MKWFFLSFLICIAFIANSQVLVVLDSETTEPIIGASIVSNINPSGVTDIDGKVELKGLNFPANLVISYVGYEEKSVNVIAPFETINIFLIPIKQESVLDMVTVTASKYEQNLAKAAVSIDIIKPDLIKSINASTADKVLNKVPGVQILDGQANIRGGSGYSYGAGSRVMLLIDDMPALQSDAGFPNWGDIPIENLSQIEIVKGAASTLYGSAAMNGIINYRTAYATSKPENRISIAGTYIGSPKDPDKKWSGDTLLYETNFAAVHKKKYGKLDVVASVFGNKLRSHNQFTGDTRGRINANLRYRLTDRLSFGINTIINKTESSSFFIWANNDSGVMKGLPGTVSERTSTRIYLDPTITYIDKHENKHRILSRITSINNKNNTNQSNSSVNSFGEYQFQRLFKKTDLTLTSGLVGSAGSTNSQILGDTTFEVSNWATYLQLDKKVTEKLNISAGIRYENNTHRSPISALDTTGFKTDGEWISRASANYELAKYTNLRASFGQGYRFPTLTERFVTTTFGSFSIFSNPALEPERGWSSEIGIKQGFALGGFNGFIDLAGFISEYEDMIEFTFVSEKLKLGFQPQNIGDIQIKGAEISIFGQAKLFDIPINIFGGYTYIDPIYKNYDQSEVVRNSVSEPQNVLKYRAKHLAKMDIEFNFAPLFGKKIQERLKGLKIAGSYQSASHVINIDKAFETIPQLGDLDFFGIGQYRDFNNKGYHLIDLRASITYRKSTWTALINNVTNFEYSLRPALIEAPRSYALRWDYAF